MTRGAVMMKDYLAYRKNWNTLRREAMEIERSNITQILHNITEGKIMLSEY